jgi:hypothetical protein
MTSSVFASVRRRLRRRKYRRGARLTQFIAPDVRRDVEIVDDSEIDEGFVIARLRTWNVLYTFRLGEQPPELSEPQRIAIDQLWRWTGHPWGGPVPP